MERAVKKISGIIVFLCCLSAAADLYAQPRFFQKKDKTPQEVIRKYGRQQMYENLNLTEDQKAAIEKNRKKYHVRMKQISRDIRALNDLINTELEKTDLNQKKVRRLRADLNRLQAEYNDLRLEGIMGVRDILSPRQYEMFFNAIRE